MAPEHGKPASSASSSSYEDDTSGDEQGVEARFSTQNTPILPPARQESGGEEDDDEDNDSEDSEEEGEEGGDDSIKRQLPPPPAAARQESVGEEDEDDDSEASEEGEDGSGDPIKRQLSHQQPPPPQRGPKGCDGEDSEDSSDDDSDSDSEEVESAPEPRTYVPSPDLTKPSPLKRTAKAAGIAESSSSNKRVPAAALCKLIPPKPAAKEVAKPLAPEKTVAAKEAAKPLASEMTAAVKEVATDSDSNSEEVETATEPRTYVPSPDLTKLSLLKRTAEAAGIAGSSSSNKRVPAAALSMLLPPKPAEKASEKTVAKQVAKPLASDKMAADAVAKPLVQEKPVVAMQVTKMLAPKKTAAAKNKAAAAVVNHAKLPKKAAPAAKEKSAAVGVAVVAAATAVAKLPVAQGTADAPSGPEDNQVQKCRRLKEKSERYWFLWQLKQAQEVELKQPPGMFDDAFLNMDDVKATMLNNKIKKQMLDECRLQLRRFDIKKLVNKAMCDLM